VAKGLVGRNRRRNIARNNNTICTQSRFLTDDEFDADNLI